MEKKDYILENIKDIINQKGIKLASLGNDIGISQGEISKILSGERKNYTDLIPQIAKALKVPFHDLVHNNAISQHVNEVKDHGVGNVHTLNHSSDNNLYEERIKDKDEIIRIKSEVILDKDKTIEYWKDKYYRAKSKLSE